MPHNTTEKFALTDKFETLTEADLQEVTGGSVRQAVSVTQSMATGALVGAGFGSAIPILGTAGGVVAGGMIGTLDWAISYALK